MERHAPHPAFETDAETALRTFQGALGEILDALNEHEGRSLQLARVLHIDKKLAWRIVRVVQSTDPFAAAQYVPGAAAFKLFIEAIAHAKVDASLITAAKEAFAGFERLVRVHAGDRGSLEMMLTACAKTDRKTIDLSHRRMAFRGNSYIWGAQTRTYLKLGLVQPNEEDETKVDLVTVHGFFNVRQLRDDARLTVARMKSSEYDADGRRIFAYEPIIADEKSQHGIFLLDEFCSSPRPEIQLLEADRGFVNYELEARGVGDTAAVTCVEASIVRGVASRFRDDKNLYSENCANICIPTETLIMDTLVRDDTFFGRVEDYRSLVYGENLRRTFYPSPARSRDLLDIREPVSYLGRGPSVLHSPAVPKYPKLARYIFKQLGWEADRFDAYRCVLEYPVVPSTVVLQHDLPEPT